MKKIPLLGKFYMNTGLLIAVIIIEPILLMVVATGNQVKRNTCTSGQNLALQ